MVAQVKSVPAAKIAPTGPKASSEAKPLPKSPSSDDVRILAYYAWEAAGKPAGDGVEFWLKAEGELKSGLGNRQQGQDPFRRLPHANMDPEC